MDRIAEELQASTFFLFWQAGPLRVLRRVDKSLGVWHQAEDAARLVAHAGNVAERAVGIVVVGLAAVAEDQLARLFQFFESRFIASNKLSFGMGDWQQEIFAAGKEGALFVVGARLDPTSQVAARVVPGKRRGWAVGIIGVEQSRLDEHLEAVADAEQELACFAELLHHVGQMVTDLVGKNTTSGDVVAETESAGDAEDLVVGSELWRFEQAIQVQRFCFAPSKFKRKRRFDIAIGTRSTKNKDTWF